MLLVRLTKQFKTEAEVVHDYIASEFGEKRAILFSFELNEFMRSVATVKLESKKSKIYPGYMVTLFQRKNWIYYKFVDDKVVSFAKLVLANMVINKEEL